MHKKKILLAAITTIILVTLTTNSVYAVTNATINLGQIIKTLPTNTNGYNNHLDYQGTPTYLDNNSDGNYDTTSNVTWHREKAVESKVELWRGDTRFSSKYAGLDQGIIDNGTNASGLTGTGSSTGITGWTAAYKNIVYEITWTLYPNDGTVIDLLNYTNQKHNPGERILAIRSVSDLGVGSFNITQNISGTANNGSNFNIYATLYNGIAGFKPSIVTNAACGPTIVNNISGSTTVGWKEYILTNCSKTAGTTILVGINFSISPLGNDQAVGSIYIEYDRTQQSMVGWGNDANNFGNINEEKDFVEWCYNETNIYGRNCGISLNFKDMPKQIGNLSSGCGTDTTSCSYSDNLTMSGMVKSYLSTITNGGRYCSAIKKFSGPNEPDVVGSVTYWLEDRQTSTDPYRYEEYNRLYNLFYKAVETSVCPNIQTGGPDLASITNSAGVLFSNSFLGNFSSNIDFFSWHRYPTSNTLTDPAGGARSLEGTLNTTKTLFTTYNVNSSNVCIDIGELNENNQNMVQNYSTIASASYNSMLATITKYDLCVVQQFYQWADDSPQGTSQAEGNSSGVRRVALQEPLNGGEQLYSLYNTTREYYNKVPGSSIVYNSTDNDTLVYIVPVQSNVTIRFGVVNAKNFTETINITINTTAPSITNERNGTTYNITGTGNSRTVLITGIEPFDTEWYSLNTTYAVISNGTCFTNTYANYCFNTDVYIFNNATINNNSLLLDDWSLGFTTTTGVINITIDSWDIYGNNSMRITSPTIGNVVTPAIRNTLTGTEYTNIYGGSSYSYNTSFVANTAITSYYYTTPTPITNYWFVNATNNNTGEIINEWELLDGLNDGSGTIYETNNASILFNGLHDNTGNGNTITKAEECTIGRIETTDVITRSGYITCNDPTNNPILGKTNRLFPNNNSWGITTFIRPYTISPNGTPDTIFFFSRDDGTTGNNSAITIRTKNNSTLEMSFRNGSNITETFTIGSISTGQWSFIAITYDGTTLKTYLNNILVSTRTRSFYGFGAANATIYGIGNGEKYSGDIGVTRIYSTLDYDTTFPYNEYYRNSTISIEQTAFYNFKTYNTTETLTGTASAFSYSDYEANSIPTNTPYTFNFNPTYSSINVSVKQAGTNNSIGNYTITFYGQITTSFNITNTSQIVNLGYDNYNYTINKTGYYNKTGSYNVTQQTYIQNLTVYNLTSHYLAVRFRNSILGINETNFTVSAYSTTYNVTVTANTTNGTVIIPWFSDNNFNITAYNGANTSNTVLVTNTTNVTGPATVNYTLTGVIANSIYFNFFDEQTQSPLNGTPVTVYVTSSSYTFNFTDNTGNRTVNNIPPGNYVITALAPGYITRTYNTILTSGETETINIYLLNNSSGTYIRFTVLDQSYNVLQTATVNAVRKNISGTNYYEVGDCTTDNNGECIINLETLTATYKFLACYSGTCYTTPDTTLSRDTYPIVINIGSNGLESVFQDSNLQTGITYNNGTFTYTVTDTNNNVRSSYLTISRINGGREIPLQTITGTGTTIILTSSYANTSIGDGIVARGYTVMQGNPVLTAIKTSVANNLGTGRNASLILLFLGLAITVVFIFSWNPIAPPIIFGVMLMIFQRIGLITIGVETLAAVFVIIAIAIFRMRNI